MVTRFAVGEIDPVTLAFYRYAIAMICLLPVLPFVWPKTRVPAADVTTIALLGAAFFGFFPWAFSAALQYTTANTRHFEEDYRLRFLTGGFHPSNEDGTLRLDYTQQAVAAMLQYVESR